MGSCFLTRAELWPLSGKWSLGRKKPWTGKQGPCCWLAPVLLAPVRKVAFKSRPSGVSLFFPSSGSQGRVFDDRRHHPGWPWMDDDWV